MRLFSILFLLITLSIASCDDGDVIVTSFDFEDADLQYCGEPGDYVFYKINNEVSESLSLKLSTSDTLFIEADTTTYNLNGTGNFVNYRRYNGDVTSSYFCSSVPPASPTVDVEYIAEAGTATITTILDLDDNDGVPFVDSDDPLEEGYGDLDGDGVPNYYDFDDDGDNVPTLTELGENPDEPRNSDGEDNADYLDTDDDNDGILTRNEDADGDLNPLNDVTNAEVGPDYLNPNVANETIINEYRQHSYSLASNATVVLNDLVLENEAEEIVQETLVMGVIENAATGTITLTPIFSIED